MDRERSLQRLAQLIADSPHNLVSRGDRARLASEHIPEAVALEPLLEATAGSRWLDLGTGGGLPGLALAIVRPDVTWVLLDATRKKIKAVEEFAAALNLPNVQVLHARAESAARTELRARFDGVVSRAVAPLPVLAELARGFLAPSGRLVAVKGPAWEEELTAAHTALRLLQLDLIDSLRVASAVRPTWVVRMEASGPPPSFYPRKVGVPRSSPLGG